MTTEVRERWGARLDSWGFRAVAVCVFFLPLSLPMSRIGIAASLALAVASVIVRRTRPRLTASFWLAMAFVVAMLVATIFGVAPERGLQKIDKLFWLSGIWSVTVLVSNRKRLETLLVCLVCGAGLMACEILVMQPIRAVEVLKEGWAHDVTSVFVHIGSMTDAQRLLVSLPVSLGLFWAGTIRRWRFLQASGIALQVVAAVLMFKRGSWAALLLSVVAVMFVFGRRRAMIAAAGVVIVLGCCVPALRSRVSDLRLELDVSRGGRLLMWTRAVPALIQEHPWGIGYRVLTNRMMRQADHRIERNRDHLHSNPLQVLVEAGWIGLLIYTLWMCAALGDSVRFARQEARGPPGRRAYAWLILIALGGMIINGLVEYNLGDSEILLHYVFLTGCAAAGRRWAAQAQDETVI